MYVNCSVSPFSLHWPFNLILHNLLHTVLYICSMYRVYTFCCFVFCFHFIFAVILLVVAIDVVVVVIVINLFFFSCYMLYVSLDSFWFLFLFDCVPSSQERSNRSNSSITFVWLFFDCCVCMSVHMYLCIARSLSQSYFVFVCRLLPFQ